MVKCLNCRKPCQSGYCTEGCLLNNEPGWKDEDKESEDNDIEV